MSISLHDLSITSLSYSELADDIISAARTAEKPVHLVTLNPEIWVDAHASIPLRHALETARWVTADGIGIVLAQRWLGLEQSPRRTGADLVAELLTRPVTLYLLGSSEENSKTAVEVIRSQGFRAKIVGHRNGFFELGMIPQIAEQIRNVDPDIILVGMGSPRQDKAIQELKLHLARGVLIGVGGVIDGLAGAVKRSPKWMQRMGIEWLWRIMRQPERFKRLATMLPKLISLLLSDGGAH